ncbi:hypothetical protein LCGC14_1712240 [marine sediment metagenome]|uniref:Uncharacterized protein n=1 Tax=marine sediment metagenome TaxID=412755 RepID=A0A0F9KEW2_9ZZZZ
MVVFKWENFWSFRRSTQKSDLERFVEEPWSLGIEGTVRRSHQEGDVTVIDEIDLTGVSLLRGSDD